MKPEPGKGSEPSIHPTLPNAAEIAAALGLDLPSAPSDITETVPIERHP